MINKDLIKIFVDEIYSKPPKKNYPTNKIFIITLTRSGRSIWLIWLTIRLQIIKDLDIFL